MVAKELHNLGVRLGQTTTGFPYTVSPHLTFSIGSVTLSETTYNEASFTIG